MAQTVSVLSETECCVVEPKDALLPCKFLWLLNSELGSYPGE